MAAEPEVPDGWKLGVLSEVLESHRGGVWGTDAQEGSGYSVLRSTNMRGGRIDFTNVARCHVSNSVARACSLIPGDILVSKSSGSPHLVGLSALYRGAPDNGTYLFSNFTMRLRPDRSKINPEYLAIPDEFQGRGGSPQHGPRHCWSPKPQDQRVSCPGSAPPPLPEQQRLIEKVERLLEQSRTAREALDRIPALLKRFRQTVLAKAFRGELTERDPSAEPASVLLERIREERRWKWEKGLRAKGKDPGKAKYVEPEGLDTSGLPVLPEGWAWARLEAACLKVQDGTHFSPKVQYVEPGPDRYMYLTSKNVRANHLDLSNVGYVDRVVHEAIYAHCDPRRGDLLLTKDGAKTGTVAIIDIDDFFSLLSSVALIRTDPSILDVRFLQRYLQSTVGISMIYGEMTGTAIKRIVLEKLRGGPVPIAPLSDQRRIVAKIEAVFAQADAIEQAVVVARRRAQQVNQAVLARAFQGEL